MADMFIVTPQSLQEKGHKTVHVLANALQEQFDDE